MKLIKNLVLAGLSSAILFSTPVLADIVPAGVKLAEKQEFTFSNAEPSSLDVHKMEAEPSFTLGKELFDGLVSQDKLGNTIPAVATHWEASNSNKTHTFYLRSDAKWSNGEPVTAHDFAYSFRRILTPETASPYGWFARIPNILNSRAILKGEKDPSTLGVKAIDDHTLEFTLEAPVPFFVKLLSHPTLFPVYRPAIEKHGDSWTRPGNIVSNGPFKLTEWVVNEKLVMVKNENYWNAKEVVLQKITAVPIHDINVELKRYQAGELDVARIPIEQRKKLINSVPEEIATQEPNLHSVFHFLNTAIEPTNDANVRMALTYAIDRSVITKYIMGNGEIPLFNLTPPNITGFDPPKTAMESMTQKEREAAAKDFLKDAGYGDKTLEFQMAIPSFKLDEKQALAMIAMWKKVLGAKVTLVKLEPKVFYALKNNKEYAVIRGGWVSDYNEPSTFLDIFIQDGNQNSNWVHAEYNRLMDESKTLENPTDHYMRAEKILATDLPLIPIYRRGYRSTLMKPHVGGYQFTNPESNYYKRDIYIIEH